MSAYDFRVRLPNGEPFTIYSPTPKQIAFHQNSIPNLLAVGSRGSGKSLALRMDAHMRALTVEGCNLILIRKTMKDLMKSHLLHIEKEMQLIGGSFHGTNYIATYPNGSKLFFSYVGHETDSTNLLSAEFLGGYFDELSQIPWEYFGKLSASFRTTRQGLIVVVRAATNPLGPSMSELKKYFIDKDVDPEEDSEYDPADWGSIRIDMEDNPYLDLKQYRKKFAGMPEHIKAAWLRGEYADEASLFNFVPYRDGPYHVLTEFDPAILKKAQIFRSFDMGYKPDPAYCLWVAHLGDRYIAFHEQLWTETIAADIARDMRACQKELGIDRVVTTYCDPTIDIQTGADVYTTKDVFEANGVPMDTSINNRQAYAAAIHTALGEEVAPGLPKLQIYRGTKALGCPYLVKSLPMMQFDLKSPLKMADHQHDHPAVALAYFLISSSSLLRASDPKPFTLRPWMKEKSSDRWVLGREGVREP